MGEGREAAEDEEKEAGVDRRKEAGEMVTDCMRIGGGSEEEGGRVGGGERETFAKSTTAKDHKLPENKDSSTAADLEQTTIVTERDKVRDSEREKDTGPLETVERTSSMTEERQEGQGGVEDGERRGLQRGTEMPPVRREGGGGGGGGGGGRGEEGGMGREGGHGAVGEGATGDEGVRRGDVGDGGGGGEGGWGWGGWGKSLWSSVSTVTGSAQTLGQKVQYNKLCKHNPHDMVMHPCPMCDCTGDGCNHHRGGRSRSPLPSQSGLCKGGRGRRRWGREHRGWRWG